MAVLVQGLGVIFVVIGGVFGLLGSYGMIKLKHPMQRLHAPSKASTVGVAAVLIGGFLLAAAGGDFGAHGLLINGFLLITAPVSALFLAKAHLFGTIDPDALPPTGTGAPWATLHKGHQAN